MGAVAPPEAPLIGRVEALMIQRQGGIGGGLTHLNVV